jgi:hypothetical protein
MPAVHGRGRIALCAFGSSASVLSLTNPQLKEKLPGMQEILHPQVIGYLRERFWQRCSF